MLISSKQCLYNNLVAATSMIPMTEQEVNTVISILKRSQISAGWKCLPVYRDLLVTDTGNYYISIPCGYFIFEEIAYAINSTEIKDFIEKLKEKYEKK